jgi:glycerophosphoryl diester phosphodiesterase
MEYSLLRQPGVAVGRVGHRGAKGHAPENTMVSFETGARMGVWAVETDVHLSKDGEVVIMHDHTVDRTTNGQGFIKDMTVAELKQLDAGSWFDPKFAGQRVPTLAELLAWAKDRVPVAIEIKNGPIYYPGIAGKTIALLRQYDMLHQAILISFDHFVLREARLIEPDVITGILYVGGLVDAIAAARAAGANAIHPNWAFITPDLVHAAHEAGMGISPWCPNDLPTIRLLADMGVDSIGSDYPDLFDQMTV